MITKLFVTSVIELGKDRVRDHCHLSGTFRGAAQEDYNPKYKVPMFPQLYFTICLAMIVTCELKKNWEIAKEIFLVYQIMKKSTFLLRNRSSLTYLQIRKEKR